MELMQHSTRKYDLIFIFTVIILAYAPLSGFLFSLKNDAFTGYFPPKYFFSETLRSQTIPLWNPYLNYGFPVYGDMNIGYWNPLTWIISVVTGYSVYSFTLELIFYLLLAGCSFYLLGGIWRWSRVVRINAALAYACGGYFTGHLQHINWISGMAFFPLVLYFYLLLSEKFTWYGLIGMLAGTYLFCTAAHPGLIIGSLYFLGIVALSKLFTALRKGKKEVLFFVKTHALIASGLFLVLIGPLYAYSQVLPYTNRAEKLSVVRALSGPSGLNSWLTVILPWASTKNDQFWGSEISMRNCYMGLLTIIFFLNSCTRKYLKKYTVWFLIAGFFILLSAGGWFTKAAINILPLIGLVRLSGEFVIFALTAIIILASIRFEAWLTNATDSAAAKICEVLFTITAITAIVALIYISVSKNSIVFQAASSDHPVGREYIKWLIDNISFSDCLFIQATLQSMILAAIRYGLLKKARLLPWIIAIDIVFASLLNIPYTGVGKRSPAEISQLIKAHKSASAGVNLNPIVDSEKSDPDSEKIIGDLRWYQFTPGNPKRINYPLVLSSADSFFNSPRKQTYDSLPFVFAEPNVAANKFTVDNFKPGTIQFTVESSASVLVTVQQMSFAGWRATVNGKRVPVKQNEESLQQIEINSGRSSINLSFHQPVVMFFLAYSGVVFGILCIAFIILRRKKYQFKGTHISD